MSIQFQAHLIKSNKSPALTVGYVGIFLFGGSIFLWAFPALETFTFMLAVGGILLVVISRIVSNGQGAVEVDDKLVRFDQNGIWIRSTYYPYGTITDLDFYYDSFYSQSPSGYFTENAGKIKHGMSNRVRFSMGETNVREEFFLVNEAHADAFFFLLRDLKSNGIPYTTNFRQNSR